MTGPTTWFLGIDIQHNRSMRQITLSQRQYIIDMLKDFGMEDCAPVKTPMVPRSAIGEACHSIQH